MTKLLISKATEAKALATIWYMGIESLDPDYYENLEIIFKILCDTRNIDYKDVGIELGVLSGERAHEIECAINNAPECLPTPCDCHD